MDDSEMAARTQKIPAKTVKAKVRYELLNAIRSNQNRTAFLLIILIGLYYFTVYGLRALRAILIASIKMLNK
jgi:hypothetical protein